MTPAEQERFNAIKQGSSRARIEYVTVKAADILFLCRLVEGEIEPPEETNEPGIHGQSEKKMAD
jgi:hypothetical protein